MENEFSGNRLVIFTPRQKAPDCTSILLECCNQGELPPSYSQRPESDSKKHRDLIVNKDAAQGMTEVVCDLFREAQSGHISLEFLVFLVNSRTSEHCQESRYLRFWLHDSVKDRSQRSQITQDFFKELVNPKHFPKGEHFPFFLLSMLILSLTADYTGFMMKVIRLLQSGYSEIQLLEIEFTRIRQKQQDKPSGAVEGKYASCAYVCGTPFLYHPLIL